MPVKEFSNEILVDLLVSGTKVKIILSNYLITKLKYIFQKDRLLQPREERHVPLKHKPIACDL